MRKEVKAETQRLRQKTLNRLEEIFRVAAKVGRGEIRHQRIDGRMVPISLKQRRRWVTVAKQIVVTMNSIASNFDEQEIRAQLNELEKLVNEAKTTDQSPTKNSGLKNTD
jgi:ArsR family metal-binding transcriptional regulator